MNMNLLFNPRAIAIVGASDDPTRIGSMPIRFLRKHGFKGTIFPVNPKHERIAGLPCFPTVKDIPETVDLVLIGIPRRFVPDALRQCADKNVPFVILFSAGYAEMGEGGRKEQAELGRLANEARIRVVGPNCIGIVNTHDHVVASFTSGLDIESLVPGAIGLITQSGGIGNAVLTQANDRLIGLSAFISSGNEIDLNASDFLDYLVRDTRTRSIALLLEDLKDPRAFAGAADRALKAAKPIVALKIGRSAKGREAAASHTGAMSGPDAIYKGFFRQKGICRVYDIEELLEVANLFARYEPPGGDRVAVISTSGGGGALFADLAADVKLRLPAPSPTTRDRLHDLTPAVASIANPMDITTQFMGDPDAVARYVRVFAEDDNFDVLVVVSTVSTTERSLRVIARIAELNPSLSKPLILCLPAANVASEGFRHIQAAGLPIFLHPARCASAIGHFVRYGIFRRAVFR